MKTKYLLIGLLILCAVVVIVLAIKFFIQKPEIQPTPSTSPILTTSIKAQTLDPHIYSEQKKDSSLIIGQVKFMEPVFITGYGKEDIVDSVKGTWAKIKYQNLEGWIFDSELVPQFDKPMDKLPLVQEDDIRKYIGETYNYKGLEKIWTSVNGKSIEGKYGLDTYEKGGQTLTFLSELQGYYQGLPVIYKILDVFEEPAIDKKQIYISSAITGAACFPKDKEGGQRLDFAVADARQVTKNTYVNTIYNKLEAGWLVDLVTKKFVKISDPEKFWCVEPTEPSFE